MSELSRINSASRQSRYWPEATPLVARRATTLIISRVLPVANPDTGYQPMLMLQYTVAWWLWTRGTPVRKHFEKSLDTPDSNVA
jgi:hypothetical protein